MKVLARAHTHSALTHFGFKQHVRLSSGLHHWAPHDSVKSGPLMSSDSSVPSSQNRFGSSCPFQMHSQHLSPELPVLPLHRGLSRGETNGNVPSHPMDVYRAVRPRHQDLVQQDRRQRQPQCKDTISVFCITRLGFCQDTKGWLII